MDWEDNRYNEEGIRMKKYCSQCRKQTNHKIVKIEKAGIEDFVDPLCVNPKDLAKGKWTTFECTKCGTQIVEGNI